MFFIRPKLLDNLLQVIVFTVAVFGVASAQAATITATADFAPAGGYAAFGNTSDTASSGSVSAGLVEQDGGLYAAMTGNDTGAFSGQSMTKTWVGGTFGGSGQNNNHSATSAFTWEDIITNSGASSQNYFYNLNIDSGALAAAIDPFAGSINGSTSIYANYSLDVLVNGVSVWNSGALITRTVSGTTQSLWGTSLGGTFGTFVPGGSLFNSGLEADIAGLSSFGYQWDAISTQVDLGIFTAGDAFTLTYSAVIETGGFTTDGEGFIAASVLGDPDVLSSAAGNVISAVPVPASIWLMASGLTGLFGLMRRKKTA